MHRICLRNLKYDWWKVWQNVPSQMHELVIFPKRVAQGKQSSTLLSSIDPFSSRASHPTWTLVLETGTTILHNLHCGWNYAVIFQTAQA
jgi:hypothetical protein